MQKYIAETIRKSGHAVVAVMGDDVEPSFAYTVGLTERYNRPELIIFGLPGHFAQIILNEIVGKIATGAGMADGDLISDVANMPCAVKDALLARAKEHAFQAFYRYEATAFEGKLAFQQIVIPDPKAKFPWDAGYDAYTMRIQKRLWLPQETGQALH